MLFRSLLVDDQPARLLTYEAILAGVGVECVRALSGKEAFEKLLRTSFALILLDVSMPEMDGFETARLIREHPRFEHTPIIFVTGVHISELDSLRGYQVGAIDYISVPIVPEILRSKVALLVELYRRRAELERLNRDLESTRARLEAERSKTLATNQAQLRESEERYRTIFEHPLALTVVLEAVRDDSGDIVDWRYVDANANAIKALDHSREALLDMRLRDVEPGRAEFLMPLCRRVLAERTLQRYEMRYGADDYLMCLFPMGESMVVRSGIDITDQKRADAALRLRDARSTTLLTLADRFRSLNSPGDLAFAAAEVLGETLTASHCGYGTVDSETETIRIERDWWAPGIASLAGVLHFREYGSYIDDLKRGETVICADAEQDTRTASTADALKLIGARAFVNMPIMEHGKVVALFFVTYAGAHQWSEEELAFIRDVAERTRVAVERRSSERSLATERTRAEEGLRRSAHQLRDADRRKDEFIAMLAHELRNPLVPIRTGVELLKRARERPDTIDSVRPMMERQIGHMVRMIDDLLDVSRITSGKLELQRQPVTLSSVIGTAIELNREAITAGNYEFAVNMPEPRWILNVDPTRFAQVIANLLHNAAKFTPPGGHISLDATVKPEEGKNAAELVLKVIDSGEGITAAMLPRIFDLFAQASMTNVGNRSGLGIGLAIARRLVEMHGGSIEARSGGVNQGSEFTIQLPAPRSLQLENAPHARLDQALNGLRVLVVDDNTDAADSVGMLLGSMGCVVQVAYDGPSALIALADFEAAVVLLDIGMPGMDGYETCRRIREKWGTRVIVVAITGWGQQSDKRSAAESGFDAHITKPADPTKLEQMICTLSKRAVS